MEDLSKSHIHVFDNRYSSDKIKMLKIISFLIPPFALKGFLLYIKLSELEYILNNPSVYSSALSAGTDTADVLSLLDELLPFSSCSEKEQIIQIKNFLNHFDQLKEMMDMLELLKEMNPDLFHFDQSSSDSNHTNDQMQPENIMNLFSIFSNLSDINDITNLFSGKDKSNE